MYMYLYYVEVTPTAEAILWVIFCFTPSYQYYNKFSLLCENHNLEGLCQMVCVHFWLLEHEYN